MKAIYRNRGYYVLDEGGFDATLEDVSSGERLVVPWDRIEVDPTDHDWFRIENSPAAEHQRALSAIDALLDYCAHRFDPSVRQGLATIRARIVMNLEADA